MCGGGGGGGGHHKRLFTPTFPSAEMSSKAGQAWSGLEPGDLQVVLSCCPGRPLVSQYTDNFTIIEKYRLGTCNNE